MQFLYPEWFQAFWAVLAVVAFMFWATLRKRKMLSLFAALPSSAQLTDSHSVKRERIKQGLMIAVLILAVLALAQPQWGNLKKEVRRKGVEIVFLIDTSLSMLAEDVAPSRIEKVKLEMKSFLTQLKGDRVGIVTFAGSGFIQSPLTLDYDAFLLFANSIQVGYIPTAGTSLSEAIRTSIKSFPDTKKKHQAVVLLSDGEHQEGDVDAAIQAAKQANIRIYAVGFGTAEGAPIPLRSDDGRRVSGYKKDRAGEIVITKLNQSLLERIADQTGGLYSPATPGEKEIEWIYKHMESLDKKEFKQRLVIEREDHFQLFLAFAILLVLVEMLVGEVRRRQHVTV